MNGAQLLKMHGYPLRLMCGPPAEGEDYTL
jgi:hypothetical protein